MDPGRDEGRGRRPRVLLLVSHRRNRELLAERLEGRHEVLASHEPPDRAAAALDGSPLDLLVLDGRAMDRHEEAIRARRAEEEPALLPVLLVASRRGVGLATRHLWRTVDDVLVTPVDPLELQARVASLLRARRLSLVLERRRRLLERAFETYKTLAAGIAHDFNNLLGPILGFTELSMAELPPGHPVQDNLEQVRQAAGRAHDLARRFLALGRRPTGRRRPVAVGEVVHEVAELLRVALPRQVTLRTHLPPRELRVLADPTELHQVLTNLGTNAVQAISGEGTIELRLGRVRLPQRNPARLPAGSYAELTVADDGCGMEEGQLERIFEPYFTTKAEERGTGLGLAVAQGIVQAWGGAILVESRPGTGTTFRVLLPLHEEAPRSEARPG